MGRFVLLDDYEVIKASEKAVCIRKVNRVGSGTWIPRSTIEDGDEIDEGDMDLSVQSWIAEKEGLDVN